MLRSNSTGKMLTSDDLRRRPSRLYENFTEFFNYLFFMPVPRGREDIIQLSIIGAKGTGKSTLIEYLADRSYQVYPKDDINIVYAEDLDTAVQLINDRPYQLVILDDAAGAASSRRAAANVETLQDYNKLRHILREKMTAAGRPRGGLVALIIAWQRKNDLERAMREADLQIWKAPPVEPEDQYKLGELIGGRYMRKLKEIGFRLLLRDQEAKSFSVGMISMLGREGVGIYRGGLPSAGFVMPDIMTAKKLQKLQAAATASAADGSGHDRVVADPTPADAVRLKGFGLSATKIAEQLGKSRATIYRWLNEAEASA